METTLPVRLRTQLKGKGAARKVRRAGKLPGVVYGPDQQALPIEFEPDTLLSIFRKTENRNTVVQLQLDDQTMPCLVREVQRHPVERDLLHVDFYKLVPGRTVEVKVPVRPVGRAAGEDLGGQVRLILRTLRVRCTYESIPAALEVDVTHMEIGDIVRISEIVPPEGVEIPFDSDFNVIALHGKQAALLEDVEEEEEELDEELDTETESDSP